MSNDEPMDEQLRRFLDWQAGQLDGAPDAHGMALRVGPRSGTRTADRARLVWAIVALALVAALVAVAALVGARLVERPPIAGGQLAYAANGDIYLADQDGANPRKVTAGVPWAGDTGGGPSYALGDGGQAWAPDGSHFLLFDVRGVPGQNTGHIADASGHVVATIPNIWVDATWSPDSTRIAAWTGGSEWIGTTQISVFGIGGALQESLPVPSGWVRSFEYPAFWAPDGRSVYVRLGQADVFTASIWQLPIDGSTPRQLAVDDPRANMDTTFSHDGSRLAFVNDPPADLGLSAIAVASYVQTLFVSNADGTDARGVVVGQTTRSTFDANHVTAIGPHVPRWSPDDQRIAYSWVESMSGTSVHTELRIIDVASGGVHIVAADQPDGFTLIGWSPAGDKLLYQTWDQAGKSALWTVNVDGTRPTLLAGAESGYWQPVSSSH